jgi:hypothetical protein
VRVGIATGVVVVGDIIGEEPAQEQVVVGDTPNLAARLQSVAAPNATLVAASTLRLLGGMFVYEQLGPLELKGISEPVIAWRVLGERAAESRFAAIRPTNLTRFVGRQNELHQLYELWKRTKTGKGQVALLSGEAGIGKSRVSKRLLDRIADPITTTAHFIRLSPSTSMRRILDDLIHPKSSSRSSRHYYRVLVQRYWPTLSSMPPCCRFRRRDGIQPWI